MSAPMLPDIYAYPSRRLQGSFEDTYPLDAKKLKKHRPEPIDLTDLICNEAFSPPPKAPTTLLPPGSWSFAGMLKA